MNYLPFEILTRIATNLPTKDILNLSICSKRFHDLLFVIRFNDQVNFSTIFDLSYFDSFVDVKYGQFHDNKLEIIFPKHLRSLRWYSIHKSLPQLPSLLEYLEIGAYCNILLPQLPDGLKSLKLGNLNIKPLPQLPASLEALEFDGAYLSTLPQFPDGLKSLKFNGYHNQLLPQFPDSLEYLKLHIFDRTMQKFPKSLTYLEIKYCVYQLSQLPESLKILRLGHEYNRPLPSLPYSFKHLIIHEHFVVPVDFPSNVVIERYSCEPYLITSYSEIPTYYGNGTGKTCAAAAMAERFRRMI